MQRERIDLTDDLIKAATVPAGKSEIFLYDSKQPGLALRVRASGARSFVLFYTKPGVGGSQRHAIGPFPRLRIKQARDAASIWAGKEKSGVDLRTERREVKAKAVATTKRMTLGKLLAEDGPYERSLIGRQVVNWKTAMSALRRNLLDDYKNRDIKTISRIDILNAVTKLEDEGKRGAAGDLRKHANVFLEWTTANGHTDFNPLAGYRKPKQTRAERLDREEYGRALTDDEIIKVWNAGGKLGAFGLLARICLLGGPRRSEPAKIQWDKHVMDERVTFAARWTKMGLHHDIPRTHLVDEVLTAARHFERATSPLVFPGQRGTPISGFTKLVARLVREAGVAKFTMHDLRRTLRTIMSRCGYDNDIQRLCVGQKPKGIDAVYNKDEQWVIRKMAFEAAHDYIAALIGGKRVDNVVRLQRAANPQNKMKAELLTRLRDFHAAS